MGLVVYLDGELVPEEQARVSVFDHGVLYGDGVFEGIRVYHSRIFRLEQHLQRLYDSARGINLDGLRQTHTRRKKERMHKREAQLDAQVDRILKKVHEQGMHCLTDGEKRTLQQGTKRRKDEV